jgi:hypothetical protein
MLERLIYQSRASHEFGSLHLFQLLTEARLRNEQLGITGHLLYSNGQFTQCLEGPPDSLNALRQSLLRDERHHDVLLINRHPVSARRFPDWSMAFSSYPSLHVQGMTGFFPVDEQGQGHMMAICGESAG